MRRMRVLLSFVLCFIVFETVFSNTSAAQGDTTPPALNSIEVSPKNVNAGNVVAINAKISGVQSVSIKYDSPSKRASKSSAMTYNSGTDSWEASFMIENTDESGIWTYSSISAIDKAGNKIDFNREQIQYRYNVSAWDFIVINTSNPGSSLPVLSSMEVSPKTVNIGNNVTIKAKLSTGVKTVTIRYTSLSLKNSKTEAMTYNSATGLWEATLKIETSDEIGIWKYSGMTASDQAGSTVDFNREQIQYRYNVSAWDFTVVNSPNPSPGPSPSPNPSPGPSPSPVPNPSPSPSPSPAPAPNPNTPKDTTKDSVKPVISGASSKKIAINSKFDPKKDVTAKDNVDGNVTSAIKITGTVNTKKIGAYKLTYTVADKAGNKATVTRTITVFDNVKPVISGAANKTIKVNSAFNPRTGVTASDNVDGKLTNSIKITGTVNIKKKGTYTLTYTVTDKAGNKAVVTRKITVK